MGPGSHHDHPRSPTTLSPHRSVGRTLPCRKIRTGSATSRLTPTHNRRSDMSATWLLLSWLKVTLHVPAPSDALSAFQGHLDCSRVDVTTDEAPARSLSGDSGRATAEERVTDKLARLGEALQVVGNVAERLLPRVGILLCSR